MCAIATLAAAFTAAIQQRLRSQRILRVIFFLTLITNAPALLWHDECMYVEKTATMLDCFI